MKKEVHPFMPTEIFGGILAITSLRPAGMDCRHPSRKDAFRHIHVSLGSSTPCWNDEIEGVCLN
jgi:hypothetical protein